MKDVNSIGSCLLLLVGATALEGLDGYLEDAKIVAEDGAEGDLFGGSVAIWGDRLVVGSHLDDDKGTSSGAAYVYELAGGKWSQVAKLLASNGNENDQFGSAVALSEDWVVVGTKIKERAGEANVGAAYTYRWNGLEWVERKLGASDWQAEDFFGGALAARGDLVAVGADRHGGQGFHAGAVYVYEWDGAEWLETKLEASDGAAGAHFGDSVALSENHLVVGAREADSQRGAVYVFDWDGVSWVESARLQAGDGVTKDYFGDAVGVAPDRIVVGASGDDDNGNLAGSAYVFDWDGEQWTETAKILASDGRPFDGFGLTLTIVGDRVAVGALFSDLGGFDSGTVYAYELLGQHDDEWVETRLTPTDGGAGDVFGPVASSGERIVVGAAFDDDKASNAGAAYVFEIVVLGGATTGLSPTRSTCVNQETGETVGGLLINGGWDCRDGGLEVTRGDRLFQQVDGRALSRAVGGVVFGVDPLAATCTNRTTGQSLVIDLEGQTSWDCTAAGLLVERGDRISQAVRGKAR